MTPRPSWQPITAITWTGRPTAATTTPGTYSVAYTVTLECGCRGVHHVEHYADLDRVRGNEGDELRKPPTMAVCPRGHGSVARDDPMTPSWWLAAAVAVVGLAVGMGLSWWVF